MKSVEKSFKSSEDEMHTKISSFQRQNLEIQNHCTSIDFLKTGLEEQSKINLFQSVKISKNAKKRIKC